MKLGVRIWVLGVGRSFGLARVAGIALLIGLLASFAPAQEQRGADDLFKANLPKAKIAIADLADDYHAIVLHGGDSGIGDMFSNPLSLMILGMGHSSPDSGETQRVMDATGISFTRGETVEFGGIKFLITYKMAVDIQSLDNIAKGMAKPELELTLVRFDAIKTIVPRPEVTKATFASMIAAPGPGQPLTPMQGEAAKEATRSNFKQASLGIIMYQGDYDDDFPYVQDTKSALAVTMPYIKNKEVFKSLNPIPSEFRLNMAISGVNASAIASPGETPLYYESQAWPDGTRCVAYCDGHVKFVDSEEWKRLEGALHIKMPRKGKPLPPFYWKQLHWEDDRGVPPDLKALPISPPAVVPKKGGPPPKPLK
jgi:hypothetical protein